MMFIDLDGNVVDSILIENIISQTKGGQFYYQNWTVADFEEDVTYFIGGTENFYGCYKSSYEYLELEEIHTWDLDQAPHQQVSCLEYYNNYLYYTKRKNSLHKLNLTTGMEESIREGCDTKNYNCLSISPSGDKMLVEKVLSTVLDEGTIDVQHEIWIIDLMNDSEVKILGD